jgi:hypothetical protein
MLAMPQALDGDGIDADEMSLTLLIFAHPKFRVAMEARSIYRRARFHAVRRNVAESGLYAFVSADPDELHDVLTAAESTAAGLAVDND